MTHAPSEDCIQSLNQASVAFRFKATVILLLIVAPILCGVLRLALVFMRYLTTRTSVLSRFAIISLRKREMVDLL